MFSAQFKGAVFTKCVNLEELRKDLWLEIYLHSRKITNLIEGFLYDLTGNHNRCESCCDYFKSQVFLRELIWRVQVGVRALSLIVSHSKTNRKGKFELTLHPNDALAANDLEIFPLFLVLACPTKLA